MTANGREENRHAKKKKKQNEHEKIEVIIKNTLTKELHADK